MSLPLWNSIVPIPLGVCGYFSLNNSINYGVFTKRSNLLILSLGMKEQRAEEVIRGVKGSLESDTYVDYDAN